MSTITVSTQLTTINCSCGGTYAIQERFRRQKEEEAGSWTCPYCRTWWGYQKGTVALLKEQLAAKEAEIERRKTSMEWLEERRQEALNEANHFRKSRDGMKGALTRTKRRIGHGVCPCCNRSFKELGAHMKTKHPNYISEETHLPMTS